MKSVVLVAGAVVAAIAPSPARAQAVYGSIAGSVLDTTGASLPGVSVTITSVERKTADVVTSNESGLYAKERLLPGTYDVKAELAGFKVAIVPRVRVGVDAQTKVDFRLELGEMTEAVTVTASVIWPSSRWKSTLVCVSTLTRAFDTTAALKPVSSARTS